MWVVAHSQVAYKLEYFKNESILPHAPLGVKNICLLDCGRQLFPHRIRHARDLREGGQKDIGKIHVVQGVSGNDKWQAIRQWEHPVTAVREYTRLASNASSIDAFTRPSAAAYSTCCDTEGSREAHTHMLPDVPRVSI